MRLLVCTDGSPHSMKAVHEAVNFATCCGFTEISIIHAYEVDRYPTDSMLHLNQEISHM
ncbi:MAG TPA: universal stress protein, partial [Firmicutes bacterium]|nr:universal stress protein [Bacillota bacterium]